MLIENKSYMKSDFDYKFAYRVNLGDTAIMSDNHSIGSGTVKAITPRGINVGTPWGDKFIKWYHVKEVRKCEYVNFE